MILEKGITGALTFIDAVHASGSRVRVYHQGAHLSSFKNADGKELLFLSRKSAFEPGKAIRGGVPVIFPQFADAGLLPKHGFARTALWSFDGSAETDDAAEIRFTLKDSSQTRAIWDVRFQAMVIIRFDANTLDVTLAVTNTDSKTATFTAALHTYFDVQDIENTALHGLQNTSFTERGIAGKQVQQEEPLRFNGAIDRNYWDAPASLRLAYGGHSILLEQTNFADTVVWNPWQEGASQLSDMEPEGFRKMLCVEAAVIGKPVVLAPEARFEGRQRVQSILTL
jgi:glucose-6-phosphate 1-epimerase